MRLRGHFDGRNVVLDQPVPANLRPNTPVEVVILDAREQALHELTDFLKDLWSRPAFLPQAAAPRSWKREEFYDRSGEHLP